MQRSQSIRRKLFCFKTHFGIVRCTILHVQIIHVSSRWTLWVGFVQRMLDSHQYFWDCSGGLPLAVPSTVVFIQNVETDLAVCPNVHVPEDGNKSNVGCFLWVIFGETNLNFVQSSKVGRPFFAWHTALPQEQIGRTVVVFGSTGVEAVGVVFAWAKGVVGGLRGRVLKG